MIMPLTFSPSGQPATVKEIHGKDETKRFLESLGVVEGGTVTVVTQMAGNLIVNVKSARVALSEGMARRIMI